jgi:hypothetical protein
MHGQERLRTCAVAALRTVIDLQFEINIPELALEALGTDAQTPIRQHGTDATQMRRMVAGANVAFNTTGQRWKLRISRCGTIRQLRRWLDKDFFPIARVNGPWPEFRQGLIDELHTVVVLESDGEVVQVFDPGTNRIHRVDASSFDLWWADCEDIRWFAVLR